MELWYPLERTWDWDTPPPQQALTDRHLWKQYLPHPLGSKNSCNKSSCMNARGIPPNCSKCSGGTYLGLRGTYLGVPLPILTWPGEGVPTLDGEGYLPWGTSLARSEWGRSTYLGQGEGYLTWGTHSPCPSPHPDQAGEGEGVPTLDGGTYFGVPPCPNLAGGGVPTLDGGRGTYLGVPPPSRVWTDRHLWKQYLLVVLSLSEIAFNSRIWQRLR